MCNNERKKSAIAILNDARECYEADFKYDPNCPYDNSDQFVDKIREILQAGYDHDTEAFLLEHAPQCDSIPQMMSVLTANAACGGISFITQEAGKRTQKCWDGNEGSYPILVQLGYSKWQQHYRMVRSQCGKRFIGNKTEAQRQKSFAQRLRKAVKFLHTKNYLPKSILELTMRTDALFYNATIHFSGLLFAILDYGLPSLISEIEIDDKCWMEAVELTLCRHSDCKPLTFIQLTDADIEDIIEHIWFQVVVYGCLIHTIRILGNEKTYPLISNAYQEIDPSADRIKKLEEQTQHDAVAIKEAADMMDAMESKIRRMQEKLDKTPDYSRQISALNHEHNLALRQKDEKIRSLLARIEQMETERMEIEQQMFRQDKAVNTDKPWLNKILPEENIVFLGGHPNMLKKLKEAYPGWTYIGTETEAVHNLPKTCEYIFIWSEHISHATWYHIDQNFEGREKFLFVKATNIQKLEEEMKYELWKRQQSGKDGD